MTEDSKQSTVQTAEEESSAELKSLVVERTVTEQQESSADLKNVAVESNSAESTTISSPKANPAPITTAADGQHPDVPLYMRISRPQRAGIVASLVVSMFLATLDQNIVVVSLPTIIREFGHPELLSWVIAAYMLTSSALMAQYGRFSDVFGRKAVYLFALGFFLIGSAIAGSSVSIWMLIVGRGVQGMGGGGLMAMTMIIIGDIAAPPDRPKYMSGLSSIAGISSVVGPLLGGFFTDKVSWRWVFYINLPLAGAGWLVCFFLMNVEKAHKRLSLDVLGSFFIACATICCVLFTSWGGQSGGYPWNSGVIIGLMEGAILFLILFLWQENRHPLPTLNLALFKQRNISLICIVAFFVGTVIFGAFSYLPLYFQQVHGNSATLSGLKLIPMMAGMMVGVAVSGTVLSRTGQFKGLLPAGCGLLPFGVGMLIKLNPDTDYGYICGALLLIGIGMGISFPVMTTVIQNSVPIADMANAMSAQRFFQMIGGALGVAILGAILTKESEKRFMETYSQPIATSYALDWLYVVATAFALIGFGVSLFVQNVQLFDPKKSKAKAATPDPAATTVAEIL